MRRRNNQSSTPPHPINRSTCHVLYNYFQVLQEDTQRPHQSTLLSPTDINAHETPQQATALSQVSPTVTRSNEEQSSTHTPGEGEGWEEVPARKARPTSWATPAAKSKKGSHTPRDRSQPSLLQCYNNLLQLPTQPTVSCEVSVPSHDSESQSTAGISLRATLLSHPAARTTSTQSARVTRQANPLSQTLSLIHI